ncbi:peptide MFS transporter [Actinoplanes siamensis]|nr:oligopeptide:H+ symporter [Actinoplanes siamensis]
MPAWYRSLFVADALERFGYYGMHAVLVLFAAGARADGGLGLSIGDAAALFGMWVSLMFALSLLGGWLGDRVLGQRPALIGGSMLSAAGYAMLACPWPGAALTGLAVVAVGGALFKPNHQALVNTLLPDQAARESGISLMYVGTQFSALVAPLVTGFVGERVDWQLGFGLGAAVMAACGVWLLVTAPGFDGAGTSPRRPLDEAERRRVGVWAAVGGLLVAALVAGAVTGRVGVLGGVAVVGLVSLLLTVGGYVWLHRDPLLGAADRRRLRVFLLVFLGTTLFWMIIAQAGSVLTAFARDEVDRQFGGFLVPASWLQAVTPLGLLVFAPVLASVLPRYGRRHALAGRLATGLALVGAGFLLMAVAAVTAAGPARASAGWLVACYLCNAVGEIVVAAASIAACAEVLPMAFLGRVMGMYWLFAAIGGGVGNGALARLSTTVPLPRYFAVLGGLAVAAGIAFHLGRRRLSAALAPEPATVAADPAPAAG